MTTKSIQFLSRKIPADMRNNGVARLLIFVSILAIAYHYTPYIEDWKLDESILLLPLYLFVMWRIFRGLLMRCLSLDNHIYKLVLHPEDKVAEVWVYGKWFESEKFTLGFEELTAVIHKSKEPRLGYQMPVIRHSIVHKGLNKTVQDISDYYLNRGHAQLGTCSSLSEYLIAEYDPEQKKYTYDEATCDPSPTAVSLVVGKYEGFFMMMPTYGWTQEYLKEIAETCSSAGIKILDKRPSYEKQKNLYV